MADDKDYYVANVFLVNKSDKRIEFDPSRSSIAVWTESDGKNKNPTAIYSPIPAEKIARKIERSAKWANFFAALGGAVARRTSTASTTGNARITDNYGNSANGTYTSQSTVTTNDPAAQQRASDQIAANNRRAADTASGYVSNDLKANTLFPNDKIGGNIYFPRKKFQKVMLGIFVEGVLHIITYLPPEKK